MLRSCEVSKSCTFENQYNTYGMNGGLFVYCVTNCTWEISTSNLCARSKHLHNVIRTMTLLNIFSLSPSFSVSFRYNLMKNVSVWFKFVCKLANCKAGDNKQEYWKMAVAKQVCKYMMRKQKQTVCVCVLVLSVVAPTYTNTKWNSNNRFLLSDNILSLSLSALFLHFFSYTLLAAKHTGSFHPLLHAY